MSAGPGTRAGVRRGQSAVSGSPATTSPRCSEISARASAGRPASVTSVSTCSSAANELNPTTPHWCGRLPPRHAAPIAPAAGWSRPPRGSASTDRPRPISRARRGTARRSGASRSPGRRRGPPASRRECAHHPVSTTNGRTLPRARGPLRHVEHVGHPHRVGDHRQVRHVQQPVRQRVRGRTARQGDRRTRRDQFRRGPCDVLLGGRLQTRLRLEPRLVRARLDHRDRAAVHLLQHALPGQRVEVAADRHVRHAELAGQLVDPDPPRRRTSSRIRARRCSARRFGFSLT